MRLWIDTDVWGDPDDAVALLCAAAHPDVELVGVSTVDGDTQRRAVIARELVDAPVVAGDALTPTTVSDADPDALVAIGPLTNVARLIEGGYRPPRLALMGGARRPVRHRRQMMTVEHNFGRDPDAASAVVQQQPGSLICPLDVTARMVLGDGEVQQLAVADERLVAHLRDWAQHTGAPVCLHDPLALLALLGEPVVTIEKFALRVEPDGRLVEDEDGTEHDVVVDVDAAGATARILALLSNAPGNVPYS